MEMADIQYLNLPWKRGGRTREGLDCAGLVQLWLREQMGFPDLTTPGWPESGPVDCEQILGGQVWHEKELQRGDVVFLREIKTKTVCHVAVCLGGGKILHIMNGVVSRADNGFRLLRRVGLEPAGALGPHEAEKLCAALRDARLGGWNVVILIALSIALSAASYFLRPKLPRNRNGSGRYGFDALVTRNDPQLPLPNVLGCMMLAGNSPYQSLIDKLYPVTDATLQKANKVVILCAAPLAAFSCNDEVTKINGLTYYHGYFYDASGVDTDILTFGFKQNPAQTKAEAVTGTIGGFNNRPNFTSYLGAHAIAVPVDIRASYDRNFPVYGFPGCAYQVYRLIDSSKFTNFNVTVPLLSGLAFRGFTSAGFTVTAVVNESLAGADGSKVRFKLAHDDITSISALTVNGAAYTLMGDGNQAGNVYWLNKTKGFVEFITAPAAAATILVTYGYYPHTSGCRNPAQQLVWMLTDKTYGKGADESKIDWAAAYELWSYCAASVTWRGANGVVTKARYLCDYAIDFRRPIQEHIRAVLDSCYAYLFVSNGKFVMKARAAAASVFSVDTSNIKVTRQGGEARSTFWSEQVERSEVMNRLHVFYHSLASLNAETEVIRDNDADQRAKVDLIGNDGIVEETLKLPAVGEPEQAERLGEQILREEMGRDWICGFSLSVKGVAIEPGDVVDVTHPSRPSWAAKLFRVEEINHDAQDDLVFKCSEYVAGAYI
jgi:hypothetical protein